MVFQNPEWLALLPVLALVGWKCPRLRLWRPLRVLCLLLVVGALMRPQVRRLAEGIDLFVLLDRSQSTEGAVDRGWPEWQRLLERSRRSAEDRLVVLDYAAAVVRHGETGARLEERERRLTRTRLAAETALAMASPRKPARLLVFTDGFSTEPLEGLPEKLSRASVAMDYRLTGEALQEDYRVSRLRTPERVQPGEPFFVEVEVLGAGERKVPLVIRRNGQELLRTEVEVRHGRGSARFIDRIPVAGGHRHEAVILPGGGDRLGNNRHEAWVEVIGGPQVLLVTAYAPDPLEEVLRRLGLTVQTVTLPGSVPTLGQLAGAGAVILNNVPAHELPTDFLHALPFYITEQGGGLMMAGGRRSFGAGGYFESPIDPLLPVSMELKSDHRKLLLAMAIVMDRSGSMSMNVGPGLTKMDMANEGAANAITHLGSRDLLTVIAVDSTAHEMVPLQPVGANRQKMASAARRIVSTGGGIFVYTGLEAAWGALKGTAVGQRHIILFSDAADSEEPGRYEDLLAEVTANGGTVSVIALGTRADHDAAFLEDVAKRGNGRIFFTDQPADLPSIFSQETVAVARSAFLTDPAGTRGGGGWHEISGRPLEWPGTVDGYNLSYLRDWATEALQSTDEYAAPLVAFGHRGMGRTAAVSFPVGGEHSETVRAWEGYGDFLQTITRWLLGEEAPPGLGLRHQVDGTRLRLDLLHDAQWEERLADKPPRIVLARGERAERETEVTWRRLAPGHFQAEVELEEGDLVRGAVQAGSHALRFGPLLLGTSAEWAMAGERLDELKAAAAASGGRELLTLEEAWRSPPVKRFSDVLKWFLWAALVSVLAEALVTRTGWSLPRWRPRRIPAAPATTPAAAQEHLSRLRESSAAPAASPASETSAPAPAPGSAPTQRQDRFARAKKRPPGT